MEKETHYQREYRAFLRGNYFERLDHKSRIVEIAKVEGLRKVPLIGFIGKGVRIKFEGYHEPGNKGLVVKVSSNGRDSESNEIAKRIWGQIDDLDDFGKIVRLDDFN